MDVKLGHSHSRMRLLGNRVLRKIFWPKREEVTGEREKLHIEELLRVS